MLLPPLHLRAAIGISRAAALHPPAHARCSNSSLMLPYVVVALPAAARCCWSSINVARCCCFPSCTCALLHESPGLHLFTLLHMRDVATTLSCCPMWLLPFLQQRSTVGAPSCFPLLLLPVLQSRGTPQCPAPLCPLPYSQLPAALQPASPHPTTYASGRELKISITFEAPQGLDDDSFL